MNMDPQAMALAQAMMGRGGMQGGGMMHGGMGGMAQNPDPSQPEPPPGLWEKLMALFGGQQIPQGEAPQYLPPDTLPPDAQAVQRAKAEALRAAMMGGQ